MKQLKVFITPLNESQELNYIEDFEGTVLQLWEKCGQMERDLKKALPKASISIKIEDNNCSSEILFTKGSFVEDDKLTMLQVEELISKNMV